MIFSFILTILGLAFFEAISSVDNAVINAQVLATMSPKMRKWFLLWGLILAVILMRGLLPLLVVWVTNRELGIVGSLTATFSQNPLAISSIETSAPILLIGGGTFLLLLFLHWLFLEEKTYGLKAERFLHQHGLWFYLSCVLVLLILIVLGALKNRGMVLSVVLGAVVFFITRGLKFMAEREEKKLVSTVGADIQKLIQLEIIDATFSVDGVLGAFAFTLSVPLIILGSALGALVVRQLTVGNIERIKRYIYLEKGAMYSVFFLGLVMILNALGLKIPEWVSPITTFIIVGYFFLKSHRVVSTKT